MRVNESHRAVFEGRFGKAAADRKEFSLVCMIKCWLVDDTSRPADYRGADSAALMRRMEEIFNENGWPVAGTAARAEWRGIVAERKRANRRIMSILQQGAREHRARVGCKATTRKGKRCSRFRANEAATLCSQHLKLAS